MHREARAFCESVKALCPEKFEGVRVLECGSLNINGSVRDLFSNSKIFGVDLDAGDGVDIISRVHELDYFQPVFDVVFSTEMLEHDLYWEKSLKRMVEMLKPGGLLFLTCAGEGRPEHGTAASDGGYSSPFTKDYYKNLSESELIGALDPKTNFSRWEFHERKDPCDLYFWGIKESAAGAGERP